MALAVATSSFTVAAQGFHVCLYCAACQRFQPLNADGAGRRGFGLGDMPTSRASGACWGEKPRRSAGRSTCRFSVHMSHLVIPMLFGWIPGTGDPGLGR